MERRWTDTPKVSPSPRIGLRSWGKGKVGDGSDDPSCLTLKLAVVTAMGGRTKAPFPGDVLGEIK